MRGRWRRVGAVLSVLLVVAACKKKSGNDSDAGADASTLAAPASVCTSDLFPTSCGPICCPKGATCDLQSQSCTACADPGFPIACQRTCCAKGWSCAPAPDGTHVCVAPKAGAPPVPTSTALPLGTWTRFSARDETCRRRKKPTTAFVINSPFAEAAKAAKARKCVVGDESPKARIQKDDFFCCPATVKP